MSSEESYMIPPCRVEIIPLPQGEVELQEGGRRAVFSGDIEIRCSYSDNHRVLLPRRSTVTAVYTMHVPTGYELRPIPPPAPIPDHRRPSAIRDFPIGISPPSRRQVAPSQSTPRAVAVRTQTGPSIPGFAQTSLGRTICECFWCRETLERQVAQSTPAVMVDPEPSSLRRGRDPPDGNDTPGPSRRPRLSFSPHYTSTPANIYDMIIISSSEEEEEDPDEDPDEDGGDW